jgi:hypothetical protein
MTTLGGAGTFCSATTSSVLGAPASLMGSELPRALVAGLRPFALPCPDGLSPLSPWLTGCGGIGAKAPRSCVSSGRCSIFTDAMSGVLNLVAVDLKMGEWISCSFRLLSYPLAGAVGEGLGVRRQRQVYPPVNL